jgi:hypothetical protein
MLGMAPKGDATYILAHQVIAAQLNVAMGACTSAEVEACLAAAQSLLCAYPVGSAPTASAVRNQLTDAAKCLDYFNNAKKGNRKCSGNAPNHPPVANAFSVTVAEDTAAAITLTGSDIDGDALTFVASSPANGFLSGTAPNLTYTPAANYNGSDTFTFTVSDGTATSAPATVSITVTAVSDAPVAMHRA